MTAEKPQPMYQSWKARARHAERVLSDLVGDRDPDCVVISRDLYHRLKPTIEAILGYLDDDKEVDTTSHIDLRIAAEVAWAWLCSDWGDSDGEPFKQDAINALRIALDGDGV